MDLLSHCRDSRAQLLSTGVFVDIIISPCSRDLDF